jgi:phosphoribosylformylglycinamidine (FGAM) synthase-like enzyme
MADLPIKQLGDEAPLYDRPHIARAPLPVPAPCSIDAPASNRAALLKLIGSPDLSSKRWVFEQYDHLILGNTVQQPGGDAAIVRVLNGPKGLAHDLRRDTHAIARLIPSRAASRRWRRRGATSPRSAAGRWPSPTI